MKRSICGVLCLVWIVAGCNDMALPSNNKSVRECPAIDVHFSPHGGATESIVEGVNNSKSSIFVQAYSFTSKPIAESLVHAKHRGMDVQVIFDSENLGNKHSMLHYLYDNKVVCFLDKRHPIAHNKIVLVDKKIIFTGSFNLTNGGEKNAENLLTIGDHLLADRYYENWLLHKEHSEVYDSGKR